ncbi:hypothetical protein ACIP86_06075 [Pseudomonas neuropathica]|jgi:hypothetical protein|uniref:hypothetical protein n=1 Tax=unclassified Pseudomonas TaxID=196821 RepID=UPI000BD6F423|nr:MULTISPECIES: hypothetical protein [unclassified Pseudomonas]SNY47582.1 hypothetical protein SAMN05660455_05559 [Pseudomonas sp. LAMO17WK12:I5]SNY48415.1 hypothetical protein SAMN05660659_05549 [Pseudomonas sp. LAMO17WK12:I6]
MSEDEIYRQIGQILIDTAPDTASVVIVEAELSPEDDHCKLLFDYIDGNGEKDWFSPGSPEVDVGIHENLIALRNLYKAQNMTSGLPVWNSCVITLDTVLGKLKIDFNYIEPEEG